MKKLLLIIALSLPILVFGQASLLPSVFFNTRADMRGQKGTEGVQVLLNGLLSTNDSNGGVYMWNSTSTDADDGFVTLQVTGVATGRWKRIGNGNTIKGSVTFNGTLLQTAYPVSFTALPFVPITVVIIPRSANASALSWVSSITSSGFTVNFLSVPVIGQANIAFDYIIVKQ